MARKRRPPETPPDPKDPILPAVNPAVDDHLTPDDGLPFPIVAIGASAGGLDAVTELLKTLPGTTGMAFVVVQHLSPTHESVLSDILQRATRMPVDQVSNNTGVEPDHVYVIPPGKNLVYGNRLLQLSPRTEVRGQHRPVDHFMRSLAEEHGHRAIGVILSGTANDGALGIQEIKAGGGITFAQDTSAEHSGMPRSAIATGAVDLVLPPEEIGRELGRIAQHPYVREAVQGEALAQDAALNRVLGTLRHHTGVEFAGYKRNTIARRVKRRLLLHKVEGMPDYLRMLQSQPAEIDALFQDLLINVTSFFRDPEAFEAVKTMVFPKLTEGCSREEPIRIWALGCSTGEEAYSLAIAYSEYAEASGCRAGVQIFATDLNGVGIDKARAGIYSKGIAQDVSPDRLRRYFVDIDGSYRIAKPIRDMCVFARQNVLTDPPFSRMDLVACRNMLIYLEPSLQQRVIPTLHYALRKEGFLWLGTSETIGTHRDLFSPVDVRYKIYAKRTTQGTAVIPVPRREVPREVAEASATRRDTVGDPQRSVDRLLLDRFAPPAVVLDANHDIVQFRGDTSPFVAPAPGKASLALLKMLREGLQVGVREALQRARREQRPVHEKGLRVRSNGSSRVVDVEVVPLHPRDGEASGFVVLFGEPGKAGERRRARKGGAAARPVKRGQADEEIARLDRELAATREYLQSVIEQQDAANEELQSANEEVQSSNEELQSINEELETSKEEIQSSNEELATVNEELQNRNQQLSEINNDLVNLLSSVHVAIVMLGRDLRIRRFTPAAEKLFNLVAGDMGRPLGDILFHLLTPDFERIVTDVIENVTTMEREVQDRTGRWYSLRVRPYRTLENQIDGAVVMLVDIDTLKRAEQVLLDSDQRRDEFLAMLAHELRNPLSAITNSAQLLESGAEDAGQLGHAREIIDRQARHMTRMVDELLDLARVKEGKIQPTLTPVELGAIVRQAIESTAHQREAAGLVLAADYPPRQVWVRGDPMRLAQVVSNLLDNAAKFTPRGGHVWVSVEVPAPTPAAVVRVRDDGIGIEPDDMPRIFDLFVQGSGEGGPRSGIGLGLTLARHLVGLHGGSIEATSAGAGRGSEFVVRLPLGEAPARPGAPRAPKPVRRAAGRSRRILVVDDNVDSAESTRALLRMFGHEVRLVNDGASALPAAKEMRAEVVLLDIGLPDVDGYEVARRLRGGDATKDVLLVAVTGWGREADVRKGREAGIDTHLTKPVDVDQLLDLVTKGRGGG